MLQLSSSSFCWPTIEQINWTWFQLLSQKLNDDPILITGFTFKALLHRGSHLKFTGQPVHEIFWCNDHDFLPFIFWKSLRIRIRYRLIFILHSNLLFKTPRIYSKSLKLTLIRMMAKERSINRQVKLVTTLLLLFGCAS